MTALALNRVLDKKVKIPRLKNTQEVEEEKSISKSEKISILTDSINALTEDVKENWVNFSEEERNGLIKFSQKVTESEKINIFELVYIRILWIKIRLEGQKDNYIECCKAFNILVDNILNAVEYSDPNFQDSIMGETNKVIDNLDLHRNNNTGNNRERLRQISDKILSEL